MWGSGLKAACVLASFSKDIRLLTAVADEERASLDRVARLFGVETEVLFRADPIAFDYYTPISRPTISAFSQTSITVRARSDAAVVFGMLEGTPEVEADVLVFDPQSPSETALPEGLRRSARRLAVVLNRHEARRAARRVDIGSAARIVQARTEADVVVVKCGAVGAFVLDGRRSSRWVP